MHSIALSKGYYLVMMDHAQSQYAQRYPMITLALITYLTYAKLASVWKPNIYVLYLTMDAHSHSPRNAVMAGV